MPEDRISTGLVSVIIPTRNRRDLLRETIESVRAQTYPHWEAVVVDDGSDDGTAEMIEALCREEPRIRYMAREGAVAGANACRNQGMAASRGEYLIFLDSDDLLAPECIAERMRALESCLEASFVAFMGEMFAVRPGDIALYHNVFTDVSDLDRFLALDNPWHTASPIWRREALLRLGPWDESLPSWQDWEYHVRALVAGMPYEKHSIRDSYVRVASPHRDTIGRQQRTASHLVPVIQMLRNTVGTFRSAGLPSEHRRLLCARLFVRIAEYAAEHRALAISATALRQARDAGVLGGIAYVQGRVLFAMLRVRGFRRLSALAGVPRWKKRMALDSPHSATFLKVHVQDDRPQTQPRCAAGAVGVSELSETLCQAHGGEHNGSAW